MSASTTPAPTGLSILFVDDEAQACKWFARALQGQFEVATALDGEQALAMVQAEPERFAIVVSDQRMPGLTGAGLLARLRRDHPRILRILTTAYSELEAAIEAVNQGAIWHYISKPWNLVELRTVMARAAGHVQLQRERDQLLAEKLSVGRASEALAQLRALAMAVRVLEAKLPGAEAGLAAWLDAALPLPPLPPPTGHRDPYLDWAAAIEQCAGCLGAVLVADEEAALDLAELARALTTAVPLRIAATGLVLPGAGARWRCALAALSDTAAAAGASVLELHADSHALHLQLPNVDPAAWHRAWAGALLGSQSGALIASIVAASCGLMLQREPGGARLALPVADPRPTAAPDGWLERAYRRLTEG